MLNRRMLSIDSAARCFSQLQSFLTSQEEIHGGRETEELEWTKKTEEEAKAKTKAEEKTKLEEEAEAGEKTNLERVVTFERNWMEALGVLPAQQSELLSNPTISTDFVAD